MVAPGRELVVMVIAERLAVKVRAKKRTIPALRIWSILRDFIPWNQRWILYVFLHREA
jgi:hypothetical protein